MIDVIFQFVLWLVGRGVYGARFRPFDLDPPGPLSYRERLVLARVKPRNRAMQRWLKRRDRRGAIPNIGLKCDGCGYSLTGLTGDKCPECGDEFNVEDLFAAFLANEFTLDRPGSDFGRTAGSASIGRVILAVVLLLAIFIFAAYLFRNPFF